MAEDQKRSGAEDLSETESWKAQAPGESATTDRFPALRALVGIVASPRTSFEIIRDRHPWGLGLAVIVVLVTLSTLLWGRQFANLMSDTGDSPAIPYWIIPLVAAIVPIWQFLEAVVVRLLAAALRGRTRFRHCFSLVVHVNVITALGMAVLSLLRMTRVNDLTGLVTGQTGLEPGFGLDDIELVASLLPGAVLDLMAMSSFFVWTLLLLGLGAATVFRLSRTMGFAVAALHWALGKLVTAGTARVAAIVAASFSAPR